MSDVRLWRKESGTQKKNKFDCEKALRNVSEINIIKSNPVTKQQRTD